MLKIRLDKRREHGLNEARFTIYKVHDPGSLLVTEEQIAQSGWIPGSMENCREQAVRHIVKFMPRNADVESVRKAMEESD